MCFLSHVVFFGIIIHTRTYALKNPCQLCGLNMVGYGKYGTVSHGDVSYSGLVKRLISAICIHNFHKGRMISAKREKKNQSSCQIV